MMKAIFHYDAGPRLQARFAALRAEGFDITPCPEADDALLAALLPEAEVLLHVLKPATAAIIAQAPQSPADPEDRCRGQHDRPRGGAGARHRGRQHAGHQHAGRRRDGAAADARRAAQSGRARPGLPRGNGLGSRSRVAGARRRIARAHRRAGRRRHGAAGAGADIARVRRAPGLLVARRASRTRHSARRARRAARDRRHRLAARAAGTRDRAADRRRRAGAHEAGRDPGQYRARRAGRRGARWSRR